MDAKPTPSHRVAVAVAHAHEELTAVTDAVAWSMTAAQAGATLAELHQVKAQVAELEARVAAHADSVGVGEEEGTSSSAVWVANQTRQTRAVAHGAVSLGKALDARPRTREAFAAARICEAQARVILHWLGKLPDSLDEVMVVKAEQFLLDQAAEQDAKALGAIGRRLWEVVAPDEADAREAAQLAKEEAAAAKAAILTGYDDGHGKAHFKGVVPSFHWAALQKALTAIASAKHRNATEGAGASVARRPGPEAMGEAFCELIESLTEKDLPDTGGVSATVVVMIDQQVLTQGLEKAGVLDAGGRISPAMARRLACEAGIVPAVMDGRSQVLDLGRKKRLFTKAQRLALILRQHGQCAAEGCDRSSGLHAHHLDPWSRGGKTDLDNAIGLCHWHHNRAHDNAYDMTTLSNGQVRFHRRR